MRKENLEASLGGILDALEKENLRRRLRVIDEISGTRIIIEGRALINFSSNDYLGLSSHPAIVEAMREASLRWGTGSTASRLVCGTMAEHALLEEEIAAAKGTEAALLFSSGFAAAAGTIPSLVGRGDVVILDKLAHACLIDGARSSGAVLRVFPHNNLDRLEAHLRWAFDKHRGGRVMIVTESIFSMDGDQAPLREIVELKDRHGAILFLDEAHAVGVRGRGVRGLAGELGLGDRVEIQMGTLGKALGVSGGYIAGSRTLADFLINRARSFVFSTAPPPSVAAACRTALRITLSPEGDALRAKLQKNLLQLTATLNLCPTAGAIVPLILGNEKTALVVAEGMLESGFYVPAIRYPTVPRNTSRLRITLSAAHAPEEIRKLSESLLPFSVPGFSATAATTAAIK